MKRKLGIVIEGTDCTGKTTLVNRLRSKLSPQGWYSLSLSHRIGNQFERYLGNYLKDERIIYDRAHFSEIVYGKLWRDNSGLDAWQRDFLNDFVLENFVVVLVQAPVSVLKQRYNMRQQDQTIDLAELEQTQDMFIKEMEDDRVIQYQSVNPESLDLVVQQIVTTIDDGGPSISPLKEPQTSTHQKSFILLEGANGSGKSTLAKLLKINMLGWGVKTLDYKDTDQFMRYLRAYSLNKETIFDRGHLSEVVYAQLFRDGNSFLPQELTALNAYAARRGTIIFCNPPLSTIKERVMNASYPKHIRAEDLEKVVSLFKNKFNQYELPYLEVDTSDPLAIDALIQNIRALYQTLTYQDMNWK